MHAEVKENPNVTNIPIDTSQPQPMKKLKLKGVRSLRTVEVELATGEVITINRKGRKTFVAEHPGSKLVTAKRIPVEEEKTETKKKKGKKKTGAKKRVKH